MLFSRSKKSLKQINESGAALVITLLIMTILIGFAALVLARTYTESAISMNDTAESRSFAAAEAALEDSTRDFATIVEQKLNPTDTDIINLKGKRVPYFEDNGYTFTKVITQVAAAKVVQQNKGQFQGLISLRDEWQIDITATHTATGVVTQVRRRFFNDRIPIFQFGAFYQDDLEVQDPPTFIFNGRIHTNGNFFTNSNGNDIRYKSKITVAGEIVRDRWKTGAALTTGEQSNAVYAPNATNTDVQFPTNRGSVTCSSGTGGILKDVTGRNFPYPNCVTNSAWSSFSTGFEGNVVNKAKLLTLPVSRINEPLIEMVRRGKNVNDKANFGGTISKVTTANEDNGTLSRERYANKEGIRITLSDSQDKLPQCANATGACGVRLDATLSGNSLGYQPKPMTDYTATALNGSRFRYGSRQVWIKIELVSFDYDNQKPITKDVTEDILSLGVTEPIIDSSVPNLKVRNLDGTDVTLSNDSRSIVKLQRYAIKGTQIQNFSTKFLTYVEPSTKPYNVVQRYKIPSNKTLSDCLVSPFPCTADNTFAAPADNSGPYTSNGSIDETAHLKMAVFDGNWSGSGKVAIVPFPIQLFDVREGNRANSTTGTTAKKVYVNGAMSLVDIDVANLRRFLNGDFDGKLPVTTPFALTNNNVGLKSTDVPQNRGWVVYFSDRRGDNNFDGRYNMEDVNPNYDSNIDEDLNGDGVIDKATSSNEEAPTTDSQMDASYLAVTDHKFYRRGVRLINGGTLPGKYDAAAPTKTKGFTFASENGVYTWKNYNVSSISGTCGASSTTSDKYLPQGGGASGDLHIPASIVGDAVTVLSNNWNDGQSFALPYDLANRQATDTQVRFAMLAGDPITGQSVTEGLNGSQNGGLINFKRFLEIWTGDCLNYSGSLINLFNAFNSNGRHKPNVTVYSPPTRDWTFEESFKDPNRLPPGTPFVYFLTFTGFERVND